MKLDADSARVGLRNLRRAAFACLLLTVVMVGQCSAFGVQGPRGPSYVAVAAEPALFLSTVAPLVGPLFLIELALVALTLGKPSVRALKSARVAAVIATIGAPVTAYVGFVLSLSRLCRVADPGRQTAAEAASCAAGTASMASGFGFIGAAIALGFATALLRRLSLPPSPNIHDQ